MRRNFAYYSKFLFSHYKANGGVNMVRRITEDRKKNSVGKQSICGKYPRQCFKDVAARQG